MNFLKQILAVICLLIGLLLIALPARADQQGAAQTFLSPTNMPAIITGGANSNALNSVIVLRKGQGLGLQWLFNGSASTNTANGVMLLTPSIDGTNYDTTSWVFSRPAIGTGTTVATTNWSPLALAGYYSIEITAMTNANLGAVSTLTNQGVLFNRPNL